MSELSNTAINLLAEYTQDIRNAHKPSADLKLYIASLEARLESVLGLFGDYDFAPTVEQAIEIWNLMRNREIALAAKLKAMERVGMALIAGCEASDFEQRDWAPWHEAVNEWNALVTAAQQEKKE